MDRNLQSPPADSADTKAAFRKPLNDAANRKYRRRSPVSGSSSSDGSPKREHSSSPVYSRENDPRASDYRQKRKDDRRELDTDFSRNQYHRGGESHRHSDQQSSRRSHGYKKHDNYVRCDKRGEEDRSCQKSSYRSGRELSGGTHADHALLEDEHIRSRDYRRNIDRYPYDKHDVSSSLEHDKHSEKYLSHGTGASRRHSNSISEGIRSSEWDRHIRDNDGRHERRDYRRSSGDYKIDNMPSHEESRGHHRDLTSARDSTGHRLKESQKSRLKDLDGPKHAKDDKKSYDAGESNGDKDPYNKGRGKRFEDRTTLMSGPEESSGKKPKFFSLDEGADIGKDGGEKQSSSVKQFSEELSKIASEPGLTNSARVGNDVNAAKVAAMKAAELVNKNLTGVGCMSTEQKKKLLWGNKKNVAVEESGHRWDSTLFPDRERQEKFNKLMGVKGELKVEQNPNSQDNGEILRAEKQKELQLDLEKQYTAGLRRRDGRTVGLGL